MKFSPTFTSPDHELLYCELAVKNGSKTHTSEDLVRTLLF